MGLMLNSCLRVGKPNAFSIAALNSAAPASDCPTRFPFSLPVGIDLQRTRVEL